MRLKHLLDEYVFRDYKWIARAWEWHFKYGRTRRSDVLKITAAILLRREYRWPGYPEPNTKIACDQTTELSALDPEVIAYDRLLLYKGLKYEVEYVEVD